MIEKTTNRQKQNEPEEDAIKLQRKAKKKVEK